MLCSAGLCLLVLRSRCARCAAQVIINTPPHVQLLCMSATVRNPEDLGGWISQVRNLYIWKKLAVLACYAWGWTLLRTLVAGWDALG